MKIRIGAISRNEGFYLPQWIFHHYNRGFNDFEIWINNTNDESIQILRKIEAELNIQIKICIADDLYEQCKAKEIDFQVSAYTLIWKDAISDQIDYLFFLDIDEFWMPKKIDESVVDFLARYPNADAISFQWMLDTPIFDGETGQLPVLSRSLLFNSHVKTIIKLSERVRSVGIHNSLITEGKYINPDGEPFQEENGFSQKSLLKMLPDNSNIPEYFIFHAYFRTQNEYLSRMLNPSGIRKNQLKENRHGFLPYPGSKMVSWELPEQVERDYVDKYERFIRDCGLKDLLEGLDIFLSQRVEQLLSILLRDKSLIHSHYKQLRGIDYAPYCSEIGTTDTIFCVVDIIEKHSNGSLKVVGWSFDWFYPNKTLRFEIKFGQYVLNNFEIAHHTRPDVQNQLPDAPLKCGFSLEFSLDDLSDDKSFQLIVSNEKNTKIFQFDVTNLLNQKIAP